MRRVKVTVKRKHIQGGKMDNALSCPVALAMSDAGIENPVVDSFLISSAPGHEWSVPEKVWNFIHAFDHGQPVKPFSFIAKEVV